MNLLQPDYINILDVLKEKIRKARIKTVIAVNTELLKLYWEIGNIIALQESTQGWGTKVVQRLSQDLKVEFPDLKGLSMRNLRYMRDFALAYPEFKIILQGTLAKLQDAENQNIEILQGALAKLSWYHHITLLDKVKDKEERLFYIQETIQNGWSRDVMVHQMEGGLYQRKGKILSNFKETIAPEHSELIQQLFKDPYKFEFIYLGKEAKERDLEDALINQLTKFLLELGQYFSFLGKQYRLMLGEREYFFDLLFYHTRLKRYIIIDLKIDEFKPEYKGKMEFYLNLADEHLKQDNDEKSIGLILCKTKDGLVAEYALRDSTKPIGIAEYKINEMLPDNIRGELPSIEELEAEIEKEVEQFKSQADKSIDRIKEIVAKLGEQDEPKEKQTLEKTIEILEKVIFVIDDIIKSTLKDIIDLFDKSEVCYWMSGRGFMSREEVRKEFLNNKLPNAFNLEYRFDGFKKAGTNIFGCYAHLYFSFQTYKYCCGQEQFNNHIWEKLYHQFPTDKEITDATDTITIRINNQIEENLERLGLI